MSVYVQDLNDPAYTPEILIDTVIDTYDLGNKNKMAMLFDSESATISRIYNRKQPVNERLIMRIMEGTGWSLDKVYELAGMQPKIERFE